MTSLTNSGTSAIESVGRCWPCVATGVIASESAPATNSFTRPGIIRDEKTGASMNSGPIRASTSTYPTTVPVASCGSPVTYECPFRTVEPLHPALHWMGGLGPAALCSRGYGRKCLAPVSDVCRLCANRSTRVPSGRPTAAPPGSRPDERRDRHVEVVRVADHLREHPRAADDDHGARHQDLRDEGERRLLDLRRRLEDRHEQPDDQAGDQERRRDLHRDHHRVQRELGCGVLVHVWKDAISDSITRCQPS